VSLVADRVFEDVRGGGLLVVPLGATEQHGPHLPLSTDTDIAVAIASRLSCAVDVAPALPYGASGEHQAFAGTLSIGQEALGSVLVELGRSATETFSRVLLLCAHGGNVEAVTRAVEHLREEDRDVRAWNPAECWRGDAHAGWVETSVMLALDPDHVDLSRAAPGNPQPIAELMSELRHGGVAAVSVNGVLGDPLGATATDGERLLDDAARALTAAITDWPPRNDARIWL